MINHNNVFKLVSCLFKMAKEEPLEVEVNYSAHGTMLKIGGEEIKLHEPVKLEAGSIGTGSITDAFSKLMLQYPVFKREEDPHDRRDKDFKDISDKIFRGEISREVTASEVDPPSQNLPGILLRFPPRTKIYIHN